MGESGIEAFINKDPISSTHFKTNGIFLVALYIFEVSLVLLVLGLYRLDTEPSRALFLTSRRGDFCMVAIGISLVSAVLIIYQSRNSQASRRELQLTALTNVITVLLLTGTAEVVLRVVAIKTPTGMLKVGNLLLAPRNWPEFAAHYLLTRPPDLTSSRDPMLDSPSQNYLICDDLLGWTNGPNRRSHDGLYFSSIEGLRSPRADMSLRNRSVTHRIALIGDSFTFGDEVSYEASWGYQLERKLGPDVQVLNFGVSGYGVDQAYLRYQRDVRPWHPEIVIFGFVSDDIFRDGRVYEFLSWPEWLVPFAKPRLILKNHHLELLNVPLSRPEELASKRSLRGLPFIDWEANYDSTEWDRPDWRPFYHSYLFRFLISYDPPSEKPRREEDTSAAVEELSVEIFRSFVRLAQEAESIPIIVFLPDRHSLKHSSPCVTILQKAGVQFTDTTPCLRQANPPLTFERGGHYSAESNAAVAECLYDVVRTQLDRVHAPLTQDIK